MPIARDLSLVALGGAGGAVARYLMGLALARAAVSSGWPLGTLAVNLIGCLLIGAAMGAAERGALGDPARLLLVTGVLGGFTTFSSFGFETMALLRGGQWTVAFGNAAVQLLVGVAAAATGFAFVRAA